MRTRKRSLSSLSSARASYSFPFSPLGRVDGTCPWPLAACRFPQLCVRLALEARRAKYRGVQLSTYSLQRSTMVNSRRKPDAHFWLAFPIVFCFAARKKSTACFEREFSFMKSYTNWTDIGGFCERSADFDEVPVLRECPSLARCKKVMLILLYVTGKELINWYTSGQAWNLCGWFVGTGLPTLTIRRARSAIAT